MSHEQIPDIEDPTDFPPEKVAPGLRDLDSAIRCAICSEIYDAPMMLHCGHTFCSLCIRQTLRDTNECPHCRAKAEEAQLLKNVVLEELAADWRRSRKFILQLLEKVQDLQKAASVTSERPRKKVKLNSSDSVSKVKKSSSPASASGSSIARLEKPDGEAEVIEDSEDEAVKWVPSSDAEENEAETSLAQAVACPLCEKSVLMKDVNAHIDGGCKKFIVGAAGHQTEKRRKDTKNAWNSMFGGPSARRDSEGKGKGRDLHRKSPDSSTLERLPRPSYSVLKEKKIREMLSQHDLWTTGSKEQLVARHSQFVLLYNANLDRPEASRKNIAGIRKELRKWEEAQTQKKPVIDDTRDYLKTHDSDFKKHIEAVKASAAAIRRIEPKSENIMNPIEVTGGRPVKESPSKAARRGGRSPSIKPRQAVVGREEIIIADSQEGPSSS